MVALKSSMSLLFPVPASPTMEKIDPLPCLRFGDGLLELGHLHLSSNEICP